jgi:hypothetical protein
LIEELFCRVIVEVNALIGAADHHHDHVGLLVEKMSICDWRLEQVLVPLYPVLEIKRCAPRHKSTPVVYWIEE